MLTRLKVPAEEREDGIAMILVMATGLVLMLFSLGILSVAVSSTKIARHGQDYSGAGAAAQAGIDDYLYRINNDSSYVIYSTKPNTCSGTTLAANPDATNPAMSGWVTLPGSTVTDLAKQPQYRYDVDISSYCSTGLVSVTSTGRVENTTRSLTARVKRQGFLDYLYFTDREDRDPALYSSNAFSGQASRGNTNDSQCARRYYETSAVGVAAPRPDSGSPSCQLIQFGGGDTINGPVHTNDRAIAGNVTFNGPAYTSWGYSALTSTIAPSATQHYSAGTGTPTFAWNKANRCTQTGASVPATVLSNDFCVEAPLAMPASNSSLAAQTDSRLTATPGCLYTGPTEITFNSDGTMTVVSPYTTLNESAHPSNCTPGANIPLPANGVIYVQSVPAGYSTTGLCTTAAQTDRAYGGLDSSGNPVMYKRLATGAFPAPLGVTVTPITKASPAMTYPLMSDASPPEYAFSASEVTAYPCNAGDVFVKGTLKGRVTIGSERNIYLVDNVKYSGGESTTGSNTDLLGLIANRYVEVYNPVDCPAWLLLPTIVGTTTYSAGSCPQSATGLSAGSWTHLALPRGSTFTNPQIDAAILSVQHSFRVQNYEYGGQLGTLNVFGAIAQEYRGIVAVSGTTGYVKSYVYDTRLKYQSPPYFVTPVQAPFQVASYSESKPSY